MHKSDHGTKQGVVTKEGSVTNARERVCFRRRRELSGVEVRTVENSSNPWRSYSTGFEFLAPSTWQGEVWHRRRNTVLGSGQVLCAQPGEVFLARSVIKPGAFSSVSVDACVLDEYVAEQRALSRPLALRAFARMSHALATKLDAVVRTVGPGATELELESCMVDFVAALADELLDLAAMPAPRTDSDSRAAERVRERLHDDPAANVDLTTLAAHAGMSRFRALRVFKRRFGLPPHTYQLGWRVGLARQSLRQGIEPARVAVEYGFVDQSHLTRHFKRLLGVTPAQYARIGNAA